MKKNYIQPQLVGIQIALSKMVCTSGPGATDQNNPGVGGSGSRLYKNRDWEDWEDEEEEEDF